LPFLFCLHIYHLAIDNYWIFCKPQWVGGREPSGKPRVTAPIYYDDCQGTSLPPLIERGRLSALRHLICTSAHYLAHSPSPKRSWPSSLSGSSPSCARSGWTPHLHGELELVPDHPTWSGAPFYWLSDDFERMRPRSEQTLSQQNWHLLGCSATSDHTALTRTPGADPVTPSEPYNGDVLNVATLQPLLLRLSTQVASGIFRAYTPHGGKLSLTPLALALTSISSSRGDSRGVHVQVHGTWRSPAWWPLCVHLYWRLCSPKRLRRLGASNHLPGNVGTSLYIPYRTSLARRSSGHQQYGVTQCRLSCPGLDPEAAQIRPCILTAIQNCLR